MIKKKKKRIIINSSLKSTIISGSDISENVIA